MNNISENIFLNKLLLLSKNINSYLNLKNKEFKFINKKTNLIDGFIFKLLTTTHNSTQTSITNKLNLFKNEIISRTAYTNRSNSLNIDFYKNFIKYFDNQIKNIFIPKKNQKSKLRFNSVD